MRRLLLAHPLPGDPSLLHHLFPAGHDDTIDSYPSWRRKKRDCAELLAEEVDWIALARRERAPSEEMLSSLPLAAQKSVSDDGNQDPTPHPLPPSEQPLSAASRILIEQLLKDPVVSRDTIAHARGLIQDLPDVYLSVPHLLLPLISTGTGPTCELAQILIRECLSPPVVAELARALVSRDDLSWSDDRILLWQKGILPHHGPLTESLFRELVQSLDATAPKSTRLAGLMFLLVKSGGDFLKGHAPICRRILSEKCDGPLVAQCNKLLAARGG